jgi:carboxypeptidase C (cathepsin A)
MIREMRNERRSKFLRLCAAALFASLGMAPGLRAQDPAADSKPDNKPAAGKESPPVPAIPPAAKPAVSHRRIVLDGKPIAYTAVASTTDLKNEKDEVIARMFSVAYTAEGAESRRRPVTFAFNGGPGSSSLWLHMGSFGPFRVQTSEAEPTPTWRPSRSSSSAG